ncbi:MAG: dynamin family protein [Akkermansiaceae bacterium]|nr:dynamin family protein [Akkermansiaceae bacterium]
MFGNDYFTTRKRLTDVVVRVLALAEKTGAKKKPLEENDITKGLKNPFLFVVCGEVNAGKSSLLNGLFGENICKTNVLPETDRVQWYRYAEQDIDEEVTPILEERFRPVDFLMDFNLVDTPGTNSVVQGHQAITDRFLPVSDLIFWVFPASNPWGASTWDFISKQSGDMIEKSIFILQQADLREQGDLDVILGHMRDLCRKRIGRTLPIYPVSGKLAIQAKSESPFSDSLWRESGYPNLEKYISDVVTSSSARREVLGEVRDAAGKVLTSVEDMIERRTRLLDENEGFLNDLEKEIDANREKQSAGVSSKFVAMKEVFAQQGASSRELMRAKMGVWSTLKSLFVADDLPQLVVKDLVESVQEAVERQSKQDAEVLIRECADHWDTVKPRVKQKLEIALDDFDELNEVFTDSKKRFIRRMGLAAKQAVVNLKVRGGLDMRMSDRRAKLKVWIYMCLMLLLCAGVAGSLRLGLYPYPALACVAGGGLAMIIFVVQTYRTRKAVITSFVDHLLDSQSRFTDALGSDYRDGVRDLYIEYARLLESVRRHIVDAKIELQPNLEQWNNLFLELKEIEQEL